MYTDSDVELPDQGDNVIRTKELHIQPNPKGLGDELYKCMKQFSDNRAQFDAETEESETYASVLRRCIRVALHLRNRGITTEDVVSLTTHIHMNATVAFVAPFLAGCKVACIDPFAALVDIKAEMEMVSPKLMFVSKEAEDRIEKIKDELRLNTEIVVFGETSRNTSFDDLVKSPMEGEENFEPAEARDLRDTILIAFSSGTSGTPKGICINHYSILCQTKRFVVPGVKSRNLMYTNFSWVSGQINIINKIFSGSNNLIIWQFESAKTWKYLAKYDIQSLVLSPKYCIELIRHGNPDKVETPKLRAVFVGGSKIGLEATNALRNLFSHPVLILNPYGQSEVFGSLLMPGKLQTKKPESAGYPIAGFWYKIVNPETGKILGANEDGEIRIKSKFVMNGYYKMDSSDCFDSDGFLKTGDIGYYDDDHYFYIVERYKEGMEYRGYWFAPTYLESILYQHPAVKIACVLGLPSEGNDLTTAVVVKTDSGKDVTEEELVRFVNDRVEDLKRIRGGVIFVDEDFVPFTPSDKIKRYELRKKVKEMRNIK